MKRNKVLFLLSVDTEEEFDWDGDFPQRDCNVKNVQYLPEFQQFCESLGIRPTYLADYPVVSTPASATVLRQIADSGNAEIGAHLHPWCNPPFAGSNSERDSHVVNLPPELVKQKLAQLTEAINKHIGVSPKVFRTGRWGINAEIMKVITEAGFEVDSSIYPFYENDYFSCQNADYTPYWPSLANPDEPGKQRTIFEIPVTAGFNRPHFKFWSKIHQLLSGKALRLFRPIGIAWQTQALKKLYLSPELTSTANLTTLIDAALAEQQSVIHMYLHSSSLLPGDKASAIDVPASTDQSALIYRRISSVISHLQSKADVGFVTLSEARRAITATLPD
jgi:hypothetical protein